MSLGPWLAVDPGQVRIGVAVSDAQGKVAVPVGTIAAGADAVAQIAAMVSERQAVAVVVGHPRSLSGAEGKAAQGARAFAVTLAGALSVPVRLVDERLTTVSATNELRASGHNSKQRRRLVDQVAATVLLQSVLDEMAGTDRMAGELLTKAGGSHDH